MRNPLVEMVNLLIAHVALGAVLGLGSRVSALLLPCLCAVIEGAAICRIGDYSTITGVALSFVIITTVEIGYVLGMLARPDDLRAVHPQ